MDEFLDLVVQHWHNLLQAQLAPASFAYVHYKWYYDQESLFTKQWYDCEGEDNPYRERRHTLSEDGDKILLHTFDGDRELATSIVTRSERGFAGKSEPGYVDPRGRKVETIFTVTNESFETSDKGWDKNGTLLWGSEKGPFKFTKCTR